MSHLTTLGALVNAISGARGVELSAYLLHRGPLVDGLAKAAARGARVSVYLDRGTYAAPDVISRNRQAARILRAAGAAVHWRANMHMKAAVCDGTAFFDDRNWNADGGDVILRDNRRADVAAALAGIKGQRADVPPRLWTDKRHALEAEASMVRNARAPVEVTTEYLGTQGGVYQALLQLAQRGVRCRLLIKEETSQAQRHHAVERLQQAGVDVRVARRCGKFAVDGASRAWIGSANADSVEPATHQTDWAMFGGPSLARYLRKRFEASWKAAHAYEPPNNRAALSKP